MTIRYRTLQRDSSCRRLVDPKFASMRGQGPACGSRGSSYAQAPSPEHNPHRRTERCQNRVVLRQSLHNPQLPNECPDPVFHHAAQGPAHKPKAHACRDAHSTQIDRRVDVAASHSFAAAMPGSSRSPSRRSAQCPPNPASRSAETAALHTQPESTVAMSHYSRKTVLAKCEGKTADQPK